MSLKKKGAIALGMALAVFAILVIHAARSVIKVEDYAWSLDTLQNVEGQVVACGPGAAQNHPGVEEFALTCTAKDGTVTFQTEEDTRQGTYRQTQREAYGRLYEMEIKDWGWGHAVCSWTESDTGERRPTLVLTFPKEYTLYFTGE